MRPGSRNRAPHGVAREAGGDGTRRAGATTALRLAAAAAVVLAAALRPTAAVGQEELDVPAMAESPRQFHLGLTAGGMTWADDALAIDGTALFGLDVERLLARWASVRLAGAYGSTTVSGPERAVPVNAAVFEVGFTFRAALASLRRAHVVPFAAFSLGSVVFDPEAADLATRSQNALSYGAGVEFLPLPRIGFRAEWRRYEVEIENLFEPIDRTGTSRHGDRIQASIFWTF